MALYPGEVAAPGESEQGANAALTELEKGLRSTRLGEQAEAIVRFPRLFEKYPFPILINSGMLKLAELFRQGPNFLKMCVLRVCQESERQLDKVTSVDELVRRVVTVINSNDPVARALTLRVLGAIAPIIPERAAVHHKVRSSLDSQDTVELEAAMYAARRFAARSKTFSVDMCPKLLEMISGQATSLPVKIRLIPIFQHMHHDAATAGQVRAACLSMLPSYPGHTFLLTTLHTLTTLATHTLVDVPGQVALLLAHLTSDPRQAVRLGILRDLLLLAAPDTAHLWTKGNVSCMVEFALTMEDTETLAKSLAVLAAILQAGGAYQVDTSPDSPLLALCEAGAYSSQVEVAARGTELLTVLALTSAREGGDLGGEAVSAIEALCLLLSSQGVAPDEQTSFRRCLRCVVQLCSERGESTDQFVDILGGMLGVLARRPGVDPAVPRLLAETLAALGSLRPGVLALLLPDIPGLVLELCSGGGQEQAQTVVLLLTLLLQTLAGRAWPPAASQSLETAAAWLRPWHRYRLARAASRYGHHAVAATTLATLQDGVGSDSLHHWLVALTLLARAEHALTRPSPSLQQRLSSALALFHRALSALRAASTAAAPLDFQLGFVSCRVEVLTVLSSLMAAATSLSTSPPPAIAAALAAQSRDELQRCGRVTPQLRKVVKQLTDCAASWASLAQASFDADAATLAMVGVEQQAMASLATWVEMVCLKSSLQGTIYTDTEVEFEPSLGGHQPSVELQGLVGNVRAVAAKFRAVAADPAAKPICHLHTACLSEVVALLTSHPLPYPRFFYQSLQQTRLKLAVSPQPRTQGEPVAVNTSQYMAVKVEGVIQRRAARGGRQVAGVTVQLDSALQRSQDGKAREGKVETSVALQQEVEPHNDFFTAQFLVPFPAAGLYSLTIGTEWRDGEGAAWATGAGQTITVKSFEDRTTNTRPVAPPRT